MSGDGGNPCDQCRRVPRLLTGLWQCGVHHCHNGAEGAVSVFNGARPGSHYNRVRHRGERLHPVRATTLCRLGRVGAVRNAWRRKRYPELGCSKQRYGHSRGRGRRYRQRELSGNSVAVNINLGACVQSLVPSQGRLVLNYIENIIGTALGDALTGNAAPIRCLAGWVQTRWLAGRATTRWRAVAGLDSLDGGDATAICCPIRRRRREFGRCCWRRPAMSAKRRGDTYAGIEDLAGTGSSDVLGGDNGANQIFGDNGNDDIDGFWWQ